MLTHYFIHVERVQQYIDRRCLSTPYSAFIFRPHW